MFQFYHEVDVKRVMEGCPWSFNRKVLVMSRIKEGENRCCVELNTMDLWVQVHDLRAGFMTERILVEVGNFISEFVSSSPNNFIGVWRDYLRIRVTIDLTKPLKRKMKIRKSGSEWFWITFKYENPPTFCLICGILGHSDKLCNRLFTMPEQDIVKPYGEFMRAPFRRSVKPIGAKWLRPGLDSGQRKANTGDHQSQHRGNDSNQDPHFSLLVQKAITNGENIGGNVFQIAQKSGIPVTRDSQNNIPLITPTNTRKEIFIVENKKRKTDKGEVGNSKPMDYNGLYY